MMMMLQHLVSMGRLIMTVLRTLPVPGFKRPNQPLFYL